MNKMIRFITILFAILVGQNIFAVNYDLEDNGILYKVYSTSLAQMDIVGYDYNISENVVIPSSVKYRKAGQTRYITYSIRYIDAGAFSGCTIIKSVSFENSYAYIKSNAFANCTNISRIDLGLESIKSLGSFENIFTGCNSIKEIHTNISTPNSINSNNFDDKTYANAILYVPEGCVDTYKNTDGWSNFLHIASGHTFNITVSDGGTVNYKGNSIKAQSASFEILDGETETLTFIPDEGYYLASIIID